MEATMAAAERQAATQTAQLWEEVARLREECAGQRRLASALQRSLLIPAAWDTFPGLRVEAFHEAAWKEALISGDFYDTFRVGRNQFALVVGDVCGKGLAAAVRVPEVRYALRAFLREGPDPAEALSRVNRLLCETLDERPPGCFVAVSLAVVDGATGEVQCATAGAEPPLVARAGGSLETVSAGRLALGILPNQGYSAVSFRLGEGDILLLLTDGLTEARPAAGRPGGDLLGYEGLAALARKAVLGVPLHQGGQALLDEVRAFGGGSFRDDVCLLLAQRR